jgi:hypothetical protein
MALVSSGWLCRNSALVELKGPPYRRCRRDNLARDRSLGSDGSIPNARSPIMPSVGTLTLAEYNADGSVPNIRNSNLVDCRAAGSLRPFGFACCAFATPMIEYSRRKVALKQSIRCVFVLKAAWLARYPANGIRPERVAGDHIGFAMAAFPAVEDPAFEPLRPRGNTRCNHSHLALGAAWATCRWKL